MSAPSSYTDFFRNPEVKAYFLELVDLPLSADEKYRRFLEFCALRAAGQQPAPVDPAVGWEPGAVDQVLDRLLNAITRAAARMQRSQHADGGWGTQVEQSNFWHTAYAVLFLKSFQQLPQAPEGLDLEGMLRRGIAYLERHPEYWWVDLLSNMDSMPLYEIALMVRCLYHVGRGCLRHETTLRVYRGIDRLCRSQNEDGGWDVNIWGYEVSAPVRVWSETGATSMAIQALAETGEGRFRTAVENGMRWLAATQNTDGSWNDGTCHPILPPHQVTGQPSISKTCDALQGLLAGSRLEIPLQPYQECIDRALDWLRRQEKPIFNHQKQIYGWGWGYTAADYEHTCLVLETLLRLPEPPLPLLWSNVEWLLFSQRRQPDDAENGSWVLGHTARIALALTGFYRRLCAAC